MIFDAIEIFIRYGLSWGAVAVLLVRNRRLRRYINNHLPNMLRDSTDSDIAEIKRDVKAIKSHLGVVECGNIKTSSNTEVRNYRRLSLLLRMVKNQKNRRMKKMKQYLSKLGSRKFQSFVVGFVTQLFILLKLDEGLYTDEIAASGLIITTIVYIFVEGSVDKARGLTNEPTQSISTSEFEG